MFEINLFENETLVSEDVFILISSQWTLLFFVLQNTQLHLAGFCIVMYALINTNSFFIWRTNRFNISFTIADAVFVAKKATHACKLLAQQEKDKLVSMT